MKRIQLITLFSAAMLLALSACSPKVATGGYVHDGDIKDQVIIGQTTKDQVKEKLGSPSAQSSFGDEAWYYITDRHETVAFLKPETVQEDVVRIEFDMAGVVSKVETYNKNDGKEFAIATQTTPTEGHTLGFFEQILGNIGRFNKPANASDTVAPGRKPGSGY